MLIVDMKQHYLYSLNMSCHSNLMHFDSTYWVSNMYEEATQPKLTQFDLHTTARRYMVQVKLVYYEESTENQAAI